MLISDMDVVLTKFKTDSLIMSKYIYCRFQFYLKLIFSFFVECHCMIIRA